MEGKTERIKSRQTHLAILQRVQARVSRGADDLVIAKDRGYPHCGPDAVQLHTLAVGHGEVLPGAVGLAVQRPLQDPVAWTRCIGRFHDDISHLVNLEVDTGISDTLQRSNLHKLYLKVTHLVRLML